MIKLTREAKSHVSVISICVLTILLLLGTSKDIRGQWTANGSNINNTNTGNVGVGTTTPNAKLEVAGANVLTRITNTDAASYSGVQLFEGGTLRLGLHSLGSGSGATYVGGANAAQLWNYASGPFVFGTNGAERMRISPAGFLGIGTTNPTRPLEVLAADGEAVRLYRPANSVGWGVNLKFSFQNSVGAQTDYAGLHGLIGSNTAGAESGTLAFTTATGGAITEKLRITSGGDIGIGTIVPTTRLHVVGGNVLHQFSTTAGAEHGFYGAIRNNHFTSNLSYDGQWKMLTTGKGALISTAPLQGEAFHIYADDTSRAAGSPSTLTQLFQVAMSGNVGIGPSPPAYKLDVQGGQVNASGGLCIGGDCKTAWSQVGGGSGGSQWTTSGTGVYYNAGGVGIGTTTPGVKLSVGGAGANIYNTDAWIDNNVHVQGNEPLTQSGRGRMRVGTAWGYVGLYAETSSASTANDLVLGAGSGVVRVGPGIGGVVQSLIIPNGNLGVGTSSPGSKLDVAGTIRSGSADTNIGNHPAYSAIFSGFWRQGADYSVLTDGTSSFLNAPAGAGNIYFRSANTDKMILQGSTGNVGIGTANPIAKLHVAGDSRITGNLTVDGNIAAKYQDVAEWVPASSALAPGTVVSLDPTRSNHVESSSKAYDTRVAGVVSEQPGIALGERGENKILVATTGRVRIMVDASSGPIEIGDLLVTSGVPGKAMKSLPVSLGGVEFHRPGTIIGKALEPLRKGGGEILALLSLQ